MIEMKDSGIEWIGVIPAHWEIKRLKSIFSECKDLSSTGEEDLLSVSEYYGVARRLDIKEDDEFDSRADSLEGYKICKKNDLVINIMLAWKRGLGFSDYNGIVSPAYAVYRGKNIIPHYYHYLLRTDRYIAEFKRNSKGIIDSRLRLYSDRFFNIKTIVPPLAEQQAIAGYLDKKTAEIDKQITALEQKSDAYQRLKRSLISEVVTRGLNPTAELKDSGIEWIGEIPAHWEVKRLKDIAEFYTGNSLNESEKEYYGECSDVDSYPYIGSKDVERGISQINYNSGYRIPKNESKFVIAHAGDTLICIEGGSAGKKFGFVEQNVCFVNKLCCASTSLYDKFSYYYYNSNIFTNQFNLQLQGMIGGVSVNKIKVMSIAIPPHAEQQAIADYLDKKTAGIDGNISAISSKIDAYKRLKQSLIDEVVMGKRRIEKA